MPAGPETSSTPPRPAPVDVQPVEHQLQLRAAADERAAAVHGVEYRVQCQH